MKQSPKRPAEIRRAQLIAAAQKIFMKKGYSGATTAAIAKAARLTKGALYFHFKSKEDIFFAVVKSLSEEATKPYYELIRKEQDPDKFIANLIEVSFQLMSEDKYMSVQFWQAAHNVKKIREYLAEQHLRVETDIAEYICDHYDLKKKECLLFVRLLHSFMDGIMLRQTICDCGADFNSLKKILVETSRLFLNKNKK